ncbi:cation-translocating P-type ATPase [Comamonas denitrificans]|uniref:P-type Zn(2+) transporter n=1 Tax=Comamonas denitrificans TaxID=117506 RepID=A0A939KCL3_9BURK|nr:cation-translocating P-type ATPase [Comamonas denitrificans]MBO1248374.1 cation-translocating P-type ATPase [Comamonas denitrificans]
MKHPSSPSCCTGCSPSTPRAHPGGGDHGHSHGALPSWPRISAALILALGAEAAHWGHSQWPALHYLGMALAVVAIALTGLGIYRQGLTDLKNRHLGIHALMAVAVTGAFLIGQWPEAAMVMALYVAAERLEDQAMDRARHALGQLLASTPSTAQVQQADGRYASTALEAVPLHAIVRVLPGEQIPLDGTITEGFSSINQAPITGESTPADKGPGDTVWAGSINQHGLLLITVDKASHDSLLSRIVQAVAQAQARKAPTQRFVDQFARIYTPIVLVLAIALAALAPWLLGWSATDALYQALALLVIACPCALVLSTPITIVSSLTAAARQGLLLKGGSVLETAHRLRHIALDKTGTLTTGRPSLQDWQVLGCADNAAQASATADAAECARTAYAIASQSEHPVAQAIAQGLQASIVQASLPTVQHITALPGRGVQAQRADGHPLFLVNLRWAQEQGLATPALAAIVQAQAAQGRSISLLATPQQVLAWFAVADTLRPEAPAAIAQLHALGLQVHLFSGDHPATAHAVATQAGIAHAQGGLLPEDKLRLLADLQTSGPTAMVGDGMNDAPALAQADVGFAMGGAHSTDMAIETADVVLMHDDLRRLPDTVHLSRRTRNVLWQNIALALGIKLVFFALALTGHASMWLAVLADMGVSLLVVANGLRLRRWKGQKA